MKLIKRMYWSLLALLRFPICEDCRSAWVRVRKRMNWCSPCYQKRLEAGRRELEKLAAQIDAALARFGVKEP